MKRYFYIPAIAAAMLFVSCEKEKTINEETPEVAQISKTFTASSFETKTAIDGLDAQKVLWSDGDQITVIGVTAGGTKTSHDFTIASGQGSGTATFTGTVNDDETTFYAIYPKTTVSWSGDVVTSNTINTTQTAVAGSFDPSAAEMIAVADGSDNLAFVHGRAYFKFVMGSDNVTSVKFTSSGSRLAAKNKYNMPACTINSTGGSQQDNVVLNGSFVKGETYYVAIPLHKNALGTLTVEYTFAGGATSSLSTTALSTIKPAENAGKVFYLGTIAMSSDPAFTAPDVTIESDDTGGTINFTVANLVAGGYVTKSVTTDGLTNSSWGSVTFNDTTGEGSITFTCDENSDTDNAKTAEIHLVYTTDGITPLAETDVTVTQKKASAAGSTTYYYYYTTSVTNTDDKFTASSEPSVTFDGTNSNCGVSSFVIEGNTCTKGIKLNSGAYLQFTVSSGVTASVTFYYACRKESDNSGARIKITPTSPAGDATVFGSFNTFGTINSQTIALTAGTTYQIARDNKELALVYVALTETPAP